MMVDGESGSNDDGELQSVGKLILICAQTSFCQKVRYGYLDADIYSNAFRSIEVCIHDGFLFGCLMHYMRNPNCGGVNSIGVLVCSLQHLIVLTRDGKSKLMKQG